MSDIRKPPQLDLDLSHEEDKLIPISKELKSKFILNEVETICEEFGCKFEHKKKKENHVVNIYRYNEKLNLEFHDKLIERIPKDLGDFVEKETGENRRKYDRSITLFESIVDEEKLNLYW